LHRSWDILTHVARIERGLWCVIWLLDKLGKKEEVEMINIKQEVRALRQLGMLLLTAALLLGLALGGTLYAQDTPGQDVPAANSGSSAGVVEAPAGSYAANITITEGTNMDAGCIWAGEGDIQGNLTWDPEFGPVCNVTYVRVTVGAWDVDSPSEVDEVYLNGVFLGNLTGSSGVGSNSTFVLDSTQIEAVFGNASYPLNLRVDILVDVATGYQWCVGVDTIWIDIEYEDCTVVVPLCADQTLDVGNVTVKYDETGNITVRYQTSGDWVLTGTHLDVQGNQTDFPMTKKGNPKVGQFGNSTKHGANVTDFTYYVDISGLDNPDGVFAVAAHAGVLNTVTGQRETAWGDGCEGVNFPWRNWATYFLFPDF
jgi:hypothetical protein